MVAEETVMEQLKEVIDPDVGINIVDMGLIYGLGFPPFRGGIFRWTDSAGLDELLHRAEKLKSFGKIYEPTEQIRKMVKDGQLFHPIR